MIDSNLSPSSDSTLRIDRETVRALVERILDPVCPYDTHKEAATALLALLARVEAAEADAANAWEQFRKVRRALGEQKYPGMTDAIRVKELERQVLFAAGMLSTKEPFNTQHPTVALKEIQDGAAAMDETWDAARGAER